MELIRNYIYAQVANKALSQEDAKTLLLEMKNKTAGEDDDIAVIGIACRFPKADNAEQYWENLITERNCISEPPRSRIKDFEDYLLNFFRDKITEYGHEIYKDGKINVTYEQKGYLDEVDKFDAQFFGIPPREAKAMDPLQRLFLETAYEAIEDAGYGGKKIYGTNTGVYVGRDHVSGLTYREITSDDPMSSTGSWPGILAGRVSYIFNLRGPSLVIDTACSSGLVAVSSACRALKNKECDIAITGGISGVSFLPIKVHSGVLSDIEAADSMVRTFDRNASGTVWGEGVGALVLKPLKKAIEDRDSVYAVIKGSAVNCDGASNGITAPNAVAQEELLLKAWKEAKINPETIQYIEAHGTGTVLGDPIEIKALTNAFKRVTDRKQFCGIGAVKTAIGHLVGASGIASLIKVILILQNKMVPASLNFTEPNPYINFFDSPVYVNDTLNALDTGTWPLRACVSSFGFSGTNCHMVLENAPLTNRIPQAQSFKLGMFTLSAKSEFVLRNLITRYNEYLKKENRYTLEEICFTANTGRGHYSHRMILLVKDLDDLRDKIEYLCKTDFKGLDLDDIYYGEHKLVTENRVNKDIAGITEAEKRSMTRTANLIIEEIHKDQDISKLNELCQYYIKGADIDWEQLYHGLNIQRIHLPVYPLERKRCWYEYKSSKKENLIRNESGKSKELDHPLIDRRLAESIYQDIYSTDFSVNTHWVLNEHKIMGNYVIPGTTYLEMVREACKEYHPDGCMELKDVLFLSPAIVGREEIKEVQTILVKGKECIEFTIASKRNSDSFEDTEWVKHAEGKVYACKKSGADQYDVKDIMDRLDKNRSRMKAYGEAQSKVPESKAIELGPRWMNLIDSHIGEDELLLELGLPENLNGDMEKYFLHPSLLDNSVNAVSQKLGGGLYLPLYYKSLKIYKRMPENFYSYISLKDKNPEGKETISFDVLLLDKEGRVFAKIEDYKIKKVNYAELKFIELTNTKSSYYEIGWIHDEKSPEAIDAEQGAVLVFKDKKGIGDEMVQRLKACGREVIEVEMGSTCERVYDNKYTVGRTEEDYLKLIRMIKDRQLTSILHLFSISSGEKISEEAQFEEMQNRGIYSLYYLTRSLLQNKVGRINIFLVSECANEVDQSERTINPHGAALFGLAKVVGQEYSNLVLRCMDIDEGTTVEDIFIEFASRKNTPLIAYRSSKRYVQEFRRVNIKNYEAQEIALKEDGVYIITGGTGGLGLETGKYLAGKKAVNIGLVSRTKIPEREKWEEILEQGSDKKLCKAINSILEMESSGGEVICFSADVSNEKAVKAILDDARKRFGKINGIIHAAGVAGEGFIFKKDREVFDRVVLPKVKGTWILDKLTKEDDLDFFVVFSSIMSHFGGPGQGDYTAANAFMDSYSLLRNKEGKRTLSINWAGWKDIGMAAEFGVDATESIFKLLPTSKALGSLDEVLNSCLSNVIIGELNLNVISGAEDELPIRLSGQIKQAIKRQSLKQGNGTKQENGTDVQPKVVIKGISEENMNDTGSRLAQIWTQVLGLSEIDVYDSFSSLGGDSLLATQLLKQIDKVYPGLIDISDVFSYPSVMQMAEYIESKIEREKNRQDAKTDGRALSNDKLMSLLDNLKAGETSIEDAMDILGGS